VTADACVQTTRRSSDKRASNPERRRARSADLEKTQRSELTVVDSLAMVCALATMFVGVVLLRVSHEAVLMWPKGEDKQKVE
jgi:hypothetical protein